MIALYHQEQNQYILFLGVEIFSGAFKITMYAGLRNPVQGESFLLVFLRRRGHEQGC